MTKRILSILTAMMLFCSMAMPIASATEPVENEMGDLVFSAKVYKDAEVAKGEVRTHGYYQYYIKKDGTVALRRYFGFEENWITHIDVPETIEGKPVTRIGDSLFAAPEVYYGEPSADGRRLSIELQSVTLPSTIKEIGENAFGGCNNLKSINFPKSLTKIESGAFEGTALRNVTIPGTVKSIGNSAFSQTKLKRVVLEKGIKMVGNWAFAYCQELEYVQIGDGIQVLGDAFVECPKLKTYRIGRYSTFELTSLCWKDSWDLTTYKGVEVYGYKGSSAEDQVKLINKEKFSGPKVTFIPLTSLKKAKVKNVKAVKYNKSVKKYGAKQSVKVYVKGKKLKKGTDYTVSYKSNKKRGKATVIITGINKYDGVIKKKFKIK